MGIVVVDEGGFIGRMGDECPTESVPVAVAIYLPLFAPSQEKAKGSRVPTIEFTVATVGAELCRCPSTCLETALTRFDDDGAMVAYRPWAPEVRAR